MTTIINNKKEVKRLVVKSAAIFLKVYNNSLWFSIQFFPRIAVTECWPSHKIIDEQWK